MESLLSAHEHAFEHFGGVSAGDSLRPHAHRDDGRARGSEALESDVPGVCAALGIRTSGVSPVPRADEGQGRVRGEVCEAQLRARACTFRDLEDFNDQLKAWQAEIADVREHGTTHEPPVLRFAREAPALTPLAGRAGFLAAMPRSRVVASDWLVSIEEQSLLGAVAPDRGYGRSVPCWRPLADPTSW